MAEPREVQKQILEKGIDSGPWYMSHLRYSIVLFQEGPVE